MMTEEFKKAILPDIPFKEGDKVMRELRQRDAEIHRLSVRCNQKLNREEVCREMYDFAVAVMAGKYTLSPTGASMYLWDNGWVVDSGEVPDSEKTVGPIRDHGNPFETAIPY